VTVVEAINNAIENDGWVRQGDDGFWVAPRLTFNRWMHAAGSESGLIFGPRDLIDTDWQWASGPILPGPKTEVHR